MATVIDLFSGIGGLTAGFAAEGIGLEVAVDSEPRVLAQLGKNAACGASALRCATLRSDDADWTTTTRLPAPRRGLHYHASSPCTLLSHARSIVEDDGAAQKEGLALFRAALEAPLLRGDATYTLEQVPNRHAVALVVAFEAAFPDRVAHAVLDAADLGCPSSRKRLIVGDVATIRALVRQPRSRASIDAAFRANGLAVPAGTVSVSVSRGAKVVAAGKRRCLTDIAPTICASTPLIFTDQEGKSLGCLSPRHSAALMGFGREWQLPTNSREAQRAVGNAIPIPLSRCMARAVKVALAQTSAQRTQRISKERLQCIEARSALNERAAHSAVPQQRAAHSTDRLGLLNDLEETLRIAQDTVKRLRTLL
tara:strand:+ start:287 stop:1387 length:1101 start_codon:yes stop_codon:yes gene_type:complete